MNCSDFKNLIVVGIYGKLTGPEKDAFDEHRRRCPACAGLYRTTSGFDGIFEDKTDVPLPDWDASWRVISDEVFRKKRFVFPLVPRMRFAVTAAAVVAVFVIGLLSGRQLLDRAVPDATQTQVMPIQHFAENLEPLLVNFTNRSEEQAADSYTKVERRILADMLAQARLLKYLAESRGDDSQVKLLEDLEFVLVDITNLRPGDSDSAEQLRRAIKEKELKYRLRQFAEENPFI